MNFARIKNYNLFLISRQISSAYSNLRSTQFKHIRSFNNQMSEDLGSKVSLVRSLPEGDQELPVGKRPRLEAKGSGEVVPTKMHSKKKFDKATKRRNKRLAALPEPCSPEDVLWRDIISTLGQDAVDKAVEDGNDIIPPFEKQEEVELVVQCLSSNGSGIAISQAGTRPWAVVVPLVLPGETIRARVYRSARMHSHGDLLEVLIPNSKMRDNSRAQCKYFGSCAGCQYQMLSYETQLDLKRDVVVKAYKNYSNLPESSIPPISTTLPSPLQYGYRTKITPHFEAPLKTARHHGATIGEALIEKPSWLDIGFNRIGTTKVLDIEECPIASPVINSALGPLRDDIVKNISTYKKGVSLLLRDSLDTSVDIDPRTVKDPVDRLSETFNKHICVTEQQHTVRESVGDMVFEYNGGSFFQNNNSVLVPLTTYVRDAIFPSSAPSSSHPTHLVDAYCGAGLFAITLSPHFTKVAGIELSSDSIRFATRNARLNNISPEKCSFRSGDAVNIFAAVGDFPPEHTVLLVDPPRKGCDDPFLEQLLKFRANTVVYVSCNVHTQARDVGKILKATQDSLEGQRYFLESLRGFDLFPQTAHVESVAVLRLR